MKSRKFPWSSIVIQCQHSSSFWTQISLTGRPLSLHSTTLHLQIHVTWSVLLVYNVSLKVISLNLHKHTMPPPIPPPPHLPLNTNCKLQGSGRSWSVLQFTGERAMILWGLQLGSGGSKLRITYSLKNIFIVASIADILLPLSSHWLPPHCSHPLPGLHHLLSVPLGYANIYI